MLRASSPTWPTDWGSDNISAYAIKPSGALMQVKGSPFEAGGGPVGLAIR